MQRARVMFGLLVTFACGALNASAAKAALPEGAAFVGLMKDEWRMFVVEASGPRAIRTVGEPRTPTYSTRLRRVAYISAAGELREIDLQTSADSVLLSPSAKVAYTQPAYRPASDELYVVALRDGSSIETDIVRVDRKAKQPITVLQQRSAQFEPAFSSDGSQLLYSNVACASECPKVLQEIWTMDIVGGVAEQRTLLNSISRQPVSGGDGSVVFVSNAGGSYEVWRSIVTGQAEPVVKRSGLAESPIVAKSRAIFFIERTQHGARIVEVNASGSVMVAALAAGIEDVRDLRWGGS